MPVTINGTTGISTPGLTNSSGDMTVTNGNLVLGTSGKGIDFSATSSGSGTMTSELLSDYEEGTWTPTIIGSTIAGTASYGRQRGVYQKVGNTVFYSIHVQWNSGTGTGNLRISGLPFTSSAVNSNDQYWGGGIGYFGSLVVPANSVPSWVITPSSTNVTIYSLPTGGGSGAELAYDEAATLIFSGSYTAS